MKPLQRSQRRKASQSGPRISMFPFLAVLICTMGALVPLLLVISRTARQQAEAEALAKMSEEGVEVQTKVEDVRWRVEQLKQSRKQTASQKVDARLELGHLEDHSRQLRGKLAQYEKTIADLERLDGADRGKAAQSQADVERARSLLESAKQRLAHSQQTADNRPRSYAVVPYEGPNQTHRRPIYLECRADAVVLQPEGIEFDEHDFEGPLGPGNPLAAAVRAAREYMLSQKEFDPGAGEPYPMLLVRPDGITAYYAAREAMKSWGSDFGYELIENEWKLAYPPADRRLAEVAKEAIASARVSQARLAAAAPRQYKQRPKTVYRASNRGGFVAENAGDSEEDGGHGGYAHARPAGAVGRKYGSGGGGGGDGNSDGRTYRRGGSGNTQESDYNPYASVVVAPSGGVATTSGGSGVAAVGGYAGGNGSPGGIGGASSGGMGSGSMRSGGVGSGGVGSGGMGGGGAGDSAGGYGVGNTAGGYGVSGSGTGNNGSAGSGGAGESAGGYGVGNTAGGYGVSGSGTGNNGSAGSGGAGESAGGYGVGNTAGGYGVSGSGTGNNGSVGSGGMGASGTGISVGDSGPALGGNGAGDATGNGTASGVVAGYAPGANGQNGSAGGGPSTVPQGTGGATAASQGGGTAPGRKSTMTIVQPDGYVVGQPQREAPQQPAAKNAPSSDGMPVQPGYALRPGEWEPTPEPPPKMPEDKADKDKDRMCKKPKKSLAENRGEDWGLRNPARGTVGVTRPIRVECHADSLMVLSDRGAAGNKVIALGPNTEASVDKLIGVVWEHMESWGMAGRGMYWKPVLQVQVDADAEQRYEDLVTLLEGSGITVKKKL